MPYAVEARGLVKRYRTTFSVRRNAKISTGREPPPEHVALAGLDLAIPEGEVYGVLGPNGAGKTTLMKVLATILLPDEGELRVLGRDAVDDPDAVRPSLGVVLGEYERTFHWRLTGLQNLLFFATFYDMPRAEARARADEVLRLVGLEDMRDRIFLEFSTGQKHRLAFARGLLNRPRFLVLDEPTAGLDAMSAESLGKLVREVAADGTTVCYTTHRLLEAGRLCDRVLVLDKGRKVAEASPADLVRMSRERLALDVTVEAPIADAAPKVASLDGVTGATWIGRTLRVHMEDVDAGVGPVVDAVRGLGGKVVAVNTRQPTVEDVFVELVGGKA